MIDKRRLCRLLKMILKIIAIYDDFIKNKDIRKCRIFLIIRYYNKNADLFNLFHYFIIEIFFTLRLKKYNCKRESSIFIYNHIINFILLINFCFK